VVVPINGFKEYGTGSGSDRGHRTVKFIVIEKRNNIKESDSRKFVPVATAPGSVFFDPQCK